MRISHELKSLLNKVKGVPILVPGSYRMLTIIVIKDFHINEIEDSFPKFFKGDTGKIKKLMLTNVHLVKYAIDGTGGVKLNQNSAIEFIVDNANNLESWYNHSCRLVQLTQIIKPNL